VAEIINVYEAKTHLSKLLERVEQGEEITIARSGRPVARLVPVTRPRPRLGTLAGTVVFHPGWDDPMTEDEFLGE
jgi:prevent-host-death family protein